MGNNSNDAFADQQNVLITKLEGLTESFADKANIKQQQLDYLVKNRQAAINPYEQVTNQFANLPVATAAAEMQAEEADISLANTLDTMAATGQSAGGATALAQAALRSKKGIAASIEQQEVKNAKLAAQGADSVQRLKAEGEKFKFKTIEGRQEADINRTSASLDQARNAELQAQTMLSQMQLEKEMFTGQV